MAQVNHAIALDREDLAAELAEAYADEALEFITSQGDTQPASA